MKRSPPLTLSFTLAVSTPSKCTFHCRGVSGHEAAVASQRIAFWNSDDQSISSSHRSSTAVILAKSINNALLAALERTREYENDVNNEISEEDAEALAVLEAIEHANNNNAAVSSSKKTIPVANKSLPAPSIRVTLLLFTNDCFPELSDELVDTLVLCLKGRQSNSGGDWRGNGVETNCFISSIELLFIATDESSNLEGLFSAPGNRLRILTRCVEAFSRELRVSMRSKGCTLKSEHARVLTRVIDGSDLSWSLHTQSQWLAPLVHRPAVAFSDTINLEIRLASTSTIPSLRLHLRPLSSFSRSSSHGAQPLLELKGGKAVVSEGYYARAEAYVSLSTLPLQYLLGDAWLATLPPAVHSDTEDPQDEEWDEIEVIDPGIIRANFSVRSMTDLVTHLRQTQCGLLLKLTPHKASSSSSKSTASRIFAVSTISSYVIAMPIDPCTDTGGMDRGVGEIVIPAIDLTREEEGKARTIGKQQRSLLATRSIEPTLVCYRLATRETALLLPTQLVHIGDPLSFSLSNIRGTAPEIPEALRGVPRLIREDPYEPLTRTTGELSAVAASLLATATAAATVAATAAAASTSTKTSTVKRSKQTQNQVQSLQQQQQQQHQRSLPVALAKLTSPPQVKRIAAPIVFPPPPPPPHHPLVKPLSKYKTSAPTPIQIQAASSSSVAATASASATTATSLRTPYLTSAVVKVSLAKEDDVDEEDNELTLAEVAAARVKEKHTTTSRIMRSSLLPSQPQHFSLSPPPSSPFPTTSRMKKKTSSYSQPIDPPFDPLAGMQSAFTTSVIEDFDYGELDEILKGISSDRPSEVATSKPVPQQQQQKQQNIYHLDDDCDVLNELSETALKMLIYADDLDRADTLETYPQHPAQTVQARSQTSQQSTSTTTRISTGPIGRLLEKRTTGKYASSSSGLQI